jgi:hypothetical protein
MVIKQLYCSGHRFPSSIYGHAGYPSNGKRKKIPAIANARRRRLQRRTSGVVFEGHGQLAFSVGGLGKMEHPIFSIYLHSESKTSSGMKRFLYVSLLPVLLIFAACKYETREERVERENVKAFESNRLALL